MLRNNEKSNKGSFYYWMRAKAAERETSLAKLAKSMKVHPATFYWWLHHPQHLKARTVSELSELLMVPMQEILDESNKVR